MSDKKQPEIEQPGWLRKVCIWLARIFLGLLVIAISYCICSPYLSPERRATNNDHTRLGWYLIGLAVTGGVVLCIPRVITSSSEKYFITRVLTTGITGGSICTSFTHSCQKRYNRCWRITTLYPTSNRWSSRDPYLGRDSS